MDRQDKRISKMSGKDATSVRESFALDFYWLLAGFRPVEMKKFCASYILSATMVGRRRKFFISNRLKRL